MAEKMVTVKNEPNWHHENVDDEGEDDDVSPVETTKESDRAWIKTDPAGDSSNEDMDGDSASFEPSFQAHHRNEEHNDEGTEKNYSRPENDALMEDATKTKRRKGRKVTYCSECGKMFTRQSNLNQHMLVHTGERPWPCSVCNKTFTNKSNLKQHMLMHSGIKAYICPECSKAFTIHSHLVRHKKVHTGEKPFTCPQCHRSFTQKSNLTQHLLVHAGVKPHSCPQCAKRFSSRSTLKQHLLLHAGIRPWSCPNCDKTFAQKSNLTQHLSVHHKPAPDLMDSLSIIEGSSDDKMKGDDSEQSSSQNSSDNVSSNVGDWSCNNCEKTFTQKSELIQHLSVDHKAVQDLLEVTPSIIEGSDDVKVKDEPVDDEQTSANG